ncbi:MAG TPA: PaaI family thioesterase [Alphaproteobacteria bacterium]
MSESEDQVIERLKRRFRSAQMRFMGVVPRRIDGEWVEVEVPWRDEFMGAPNTTQGGVIATLVDIACEHALAWKTGEPAPTVNLRIDYHKPCRPGLIAARGRVVNLGRTVATVEARIFDEDGELVASGRGTFFTLRPNQATTR